MGENKAANDQRTLEYFNSLSPTCLRCLEIFHLSLVWNAGVFQVQASITSILNIQAYFRLQFGPYSWLYGKGKLVGPRQKGAKAKLRETFGMFEALPLWRVIIIDYNLSDSFRCYWKGSWRSRQCQPCFIDQFGYRFRRIRLQLWSCLNELRVILKVFSNWFSFKQCPFSIILIQWSLRTWTQSLRRCRCRFLVDKRIAMSSSETGDSGSEFSRWRSCSSL